jgi:ParB family transcriptional regulator, chromosome partitioning protein
MSKNKRFEIGKGIRALLDNMDHDPAENQGQVIDELARSFASIPLQQIEINPFQPRTEFDQSSLNELAESVKSLGLIQPLTVRRLSNNKYQLISGERRLRASHIAGLKEVPAFIRIANDQELLEMALVENLQREDLNAIEIAITYQRLLDEFELTHDKLAGRLGKNRSTITNYLRLLKLPPNIQLGIRQGIISMGHARALIGISDVALQIVVFNEVINNQLSVRETEKLIRNYLAPTKSSPKKTLENHPLQHLENELKSFFSARVKISKSENGDGKMVIHFNSDEELNRILETMKYQ